MSHNLHVIAFDIPYPPNYGGVIDVFYKLKALSEQNVRITLHCFEYGRNPSNELNEFCEKVYYYPRQTSRSLLFNSLPYIVLTRNSEVLKSNLMKDDFPILMEGLHSTFLLQDTDLEGRFKIVRTHNIEHEYYENLAKVERNIFKKYYFSNEAGKLKKYEAVLKRASVIAAISPSDTAHFLHYYSGVHYLPAFHPYSHVISEVGKSDYAFYHGNLSVGENNEAALYLVKEIFNDLPYNLVIAGNKPSEELRKAVSASSNVTLKDNLNHKEIQKLIRDAQCNVLPTFQATGIKLKLLAALFCGRTCIVNSPMVLNTELESLCVIADTAERMKMAIKEEMKSGIQMEAIRKREEILLQNFSNENNAKKIIQYLE